MTVSITFQSGATQTAPFTVGHAFKQGDIPAGQSVTAAGTASFQAFARNNWPDGSLKFAVLSGTIALTSGSPSVVTLSPGTAPGGAALTTANLKATGVVASITAGAFGSVTWSGTDWDSPAGTWVSGPVMSSWTYRKPIGADAHLVAWLEVRLYASGAVEVLPWIENGYVNVAAPTNKSETYTFSLGGTQRVSVAIDLKNHQRTPLIDGTAVSYWLGTDPAVSVTHDRAYFQATELVPTYSAQPAVDSSVVTNQISTFTPLQIGNFVFDSDSMASTGYQKPIGLLPEHDMVYLVAPVSVVPNIYNSIQRNGYSAGRYPIHYRDEGTQRPLRFSSYPTLVIGDNQGFKDNGSSTTNNYTPVPSGGIGPRWDVAHSPSVGYMAYLLTGRIYFMEEVQFGATVNFLGSGNHPVLRDGTKGLTRPCLGAWQTRSAAWSWRTLVQALVVTPDNDPTLFDEFKTSVQHNIDHYYNRYIAQAHNPYGFIEPGEDAYGGGQSILSIWQQDFVTAAMGFACGLGMALAAGYAAKLTAFFAWKAKSAIGRLGSFATGGFPYVNAAPYVMWTSPSGLPDYAGGTGPWAASWEEMYTNLPYALTQASSPNNWLGTVDGTLCIEGTGTGERSFWANLTTAMAYAVRYGVAGAKTGLDRIKNASNYATMLTTPFNTNPVWSVAPAVVPAEAGPTGKVLRVSKTKWLPNRLVVGNKGLGVLGAAIRSETAEGRDGPGALYGDWRDTNDNTRAFRALIEVWPSAGTFFMYENGSFAFTGAPFGTYTCVYRLFIDGVDQGTATLTLNVGTTQVVRTVDGAYSVLQEMARTVNGAYSVLRAAQRDVGGTYSVLQAVTRTADGAYPVLQSVTRSADGAYSILQSLTKAVDGAYSVLQVAQRSVDGAYSVLQEVTRTVNGAYEVQSPPGTVYRSVDGAFSVLNAVQRSVNGAYPVLTSVSRDVLGAFSVGGNSVLATYDGAFSVLNSVQRDVLGRLRVVAEVQSMTAWFQGRAVMVSIPANSLVFNGSEFVPPAKAEFIWLGQTEAVPSTTPGPVAVDAFVTYIPLLSKIGYECQVLSVTGSAPSDPDEVITIPDPNDGECICGITCTGTNLQFVQVVYDDERSSQ